MSTLGVIPPGAIAAPPPTSAGARLRVADATKPVVLVSSTPDPETDAALTEVLRQTSLDTGDGYTTRVILVGPHPAAALTASRMMHLPDADALRAWLHAPQRLACALPSQVLSAGRSPADAAVAQAATQVLTEANDAQQALHARRRSAVLTTYADRTPAFWRERYREALAAPNTDKQLRVLVPISRYSTFVRHSADDLVSALVSHGHRAEVLTEPDTHAKLTTPAYLGAIETLQPDLIVLINHTRRHLAQAVPPGVPFVCWVQDRMAHLFDPACGRAQGDLDFLFGHLHSDLFSHFEHPRARRAFAFVPASPERFTFHPAPTQFDAEIAYVSHQSEPPEAYHRRLVPMFAASPAIARSLDGLFAQAAHWLDRAEADRAFARSDRVPLVRQALAAAGLDKPDERLVSTVYGQYLVPMMERMVRHRVLEWSRRICERRGWRLRLHGRGWERHPTLAMHASGEAAHGTGELARLYASSAVQLHASTNTNAHQRVYECALAGGLMLRRGPSPDADLCKLALMRAAALGPSVGVDANGAPLFQAADDGTLFIEGFFRALRREPPRDERGTPIYKRTLADAVRRNLIDNIPDCPVANMPDFAFASGHETMFENETELECLVERAIGDPAWRTSTINAHRAHVLQHCTYGVAARRMLDMVADGLGLSTGAER
ncbi:MAG: hypothetical protein ACKVZJ_14980 [Phycisphaerales bacterium]